MGGILKAWARLSPAQLLPEGIADPIPPAACLQDVRMKGSPTDARGAARRMQELVRTLGGVPPQGPTNHRRHVGRTSEDRQEGSAPGAQEGQDVL